MGEDHSPNQDLNPHPLDSYSSVIATQPHLLTSFCSNNQDRNIYAINKYCAHSRMWACVICALLVLFALENLGVVPVKVAGFTCNRIKTDCGFKPSARLTEAGPSRSM